MDPDLLYHAGQHLKIGNQGGTAIEFVPCFTRDESYRGTTLIPDRQILSGIIYQVRIHLIIRNSKHLTRVNVILYPGKAANGSLATGTPGCCSGAELRVQNRAEENFQPMIFSL